MSAIATHRRRRHEAGFRRLEVQVHVHDVERVRAVTRTLSHDDDRAARLREQIDHELLTGRGVEESAFDAWRMPEDDEIANVLEEVVSERPLHRLRDADG